MNKRPLSVTMVSVLLIAAGTAGIVYHFGELKLHPPVHYGPLGILLVRVLAIVAGVFMLRGQDWARWLALLWIASHVGISFLHSWQQVIMHALFLVVFAFLLLRPAATKYFRGGDDRSMAASR
jgi:hypothetical protein